MISNNTTYTQYSKVFISRSIEHSSLLPDRQLFNRQQGTQFYGIEYTLGMVVGAVAQVILENPIMV
jgi:hypothetical protein